MSEEMMLTFVNRGLWVAALCTAPLLGIGGGVGLLVALIQAATQINEPAISFVPKLASIAIVVALFGPWLVDQLVRYSTELFLQIAQVHTV